MDLNQIQITRKESIVTFTMTKPDDSSYAMTHARRGHCIIFSYTEYEINRLKKRKSGKADADKCQTTFHKLGFTTEVYLNSAKKWYEGILEVLAARDHSDVDALVVVFMSHGNYTDFGLYEAPVSNDSLWESFTADNCPSLAGKPKLFFIQACRGTMQVDTDAATPAPATQKLPFNANADTLIMWACKPGKKASRNSSIGSVFIHHLCSNLDHMDPRDSLHEVLLRVTRTVAGQRKQVPDTDSTLLRNVYLMPKP